MFVDKKTISNKSPIKINACESWSCKKFDEVSCLKMIGNKIDPWMNAR